MKTLEAAAVKEVLDAPIFKDIPILYCSRYARLAARALSGALYIPAPAWDLGKMNVIVRDNVKDLGNFSDLLVPGKSIVIFYNPKSFYNQEGRSGTHAAVYLGRNGEMVFGEQFFLRQKAVKYSTVKKRGFIPMQILAPKGNLSDISY